MITLLLRGDTRGKIRPWHGCLVSIRAELCQVGCTGSAFVACKRSPVLG
jgi:hypothetical protein